MQFTTTATCGTTEDLGLAVNAAVTPQRPLLVRRAPGTGKTELARQVWDAHNLPLIEGHGKSTTRAHQGHNDDDAVSRLRDSQFCAARMAERASPESVRIAAPCRKLRTFRSRIPQYLQHTATSCEAEATNLAVRPASSAMGSLLPECEIPNH